MKPELEQKLKNAYPNLTEYLPLQGHIESFEHDDGWFALSDSLCSELNKLEKIKLEQVKEKFGALRVYYCLSDDTKKEEVEELRNQADAIISKYEEKSLVTCHSCGSISGTLTNLGSWMVVLCDECKTEKEKQRKCS